MIENAIHHLQVRMTKVGEREALELFFAIQLLRRKL